MNLFHKHKWLDPKGRYQTCSKCGEIRVIPCPHTWINKYEADIKNMYNNIIGKSFIQECQKCGELKRVDLH